MAYLQGRVSKFKDDKTIIIYASTRAFKAASYILNLKAEDSKEAVAAMATAA